jgi:DNA modification methylase
MPNLTAEEIEEIQRHLAENTPLPDKYRFLLFESKRDAELVWRGKSNNIYERVLPLRIMERANGPRDEGRPETNPLFGSENPGTRNEGWSDKLIWGDNKFILSSLKNGPMREEIEKQGGIKLIYIDPPFNVGADFAMDIKIGDGASSKDAGSIEEIAYRDTWGKGEDSFLSVIYERLILMRDLLANDGTIYAHCDWRVQARLRLIMDEIFGAANFLANIVWCYQSRQFPKRHWNRKHDDIIVFSKSNNHVFNWDHPLVIEPYSDGAKRKYKLKDEKGFYRLCGRNIVGSPIKAAKDVDPKWEISDPDLVTRDYLGDGFAPPDYWKIDIVNQSSNERLDYPTQKPEKIIERVIAASSNESDLVADFFCGSGTTCAVAAKLGRKWIAADLGKLAIHTTRKRLLGVQRELQREGKAYRPFEIYKLGKDGRSFFAGGSQNLRESEVSRRHEAEESDLVDLILQAYKAEKVYGLSAFDGKFGDRAVVVGPIGLPATRAFIEEIILESRKNSFAEVDILAFEFAMGLFPSLLEKAKSQGITLAPKLVTADIFDRRAVAKEGILFRDVASISVATRVNANKVAVELTGYSVSFSAGDARLPEGARPKSSLAFVRRRADAKAPKDARGQINPENASLKWSDWIDYWAVDFDFESLRETVAAKDPVTGEIRHKRSGNFIFKNEWQAFRTKKERTLELISAPRVYPKGAAKKRIAVKVVDIWGNDAMTVIDVSLEG